MVLRHHVCAAPPMARRPAKPPTSAAACPMSDTLNVAIAIAEHRLSRPRRQATLTTRQFGVVRKLGALFEDKDGLERPNGRKASAEVARRRDRPQARRRTCARAAVRLAAGHRALDSQKPGVCRAGSLARTDI